MTQGKKKPGYKVQVKGDRWTLWSPEGILMTTDKVETYRGPDGKPHTRVRGWTKGEVVAYKEQLTGKKAAPRGSAAARRAKAQALTGRDIMPEDSQRAIEDAATKIAEAVAKKSEG